MQDVLTTLKSLDYFVDNEYLVKYSKLIERAISAPRKPGRTHSHHVIPKSWFKLQNLPVDDSVHNRVNLDYRDHVMAHYYLSLCTRDQLQYANELAFICLFSRKKLNIVDKQMITHLPLYNTIYEDYKNKKKNNYSLYD